MSTATRTRTGTVAIYCRISSDRNDKGRGSGLGVARQEEACREAVSRDGGLWGRRVELYVDNDKSGWDAAKIRPEFDRLLADVNAGGVETVVAWHLDRITRQPIQMEMLWAAVQRHGAKLQTVVSGPIESALMMRIVSAMAAEESDLKSRRQLAKSEQLAMSGDWRGGKRRWGYDLTMTPVAEERETIAHVADRVIGGESLASVARWLNAEGVPTVLGGKWTGPNLGALLRRPHLTALRVHRGEVIGPAAWEPVLDRARWETLQATLNAPGRKMPGTNARKYLLSTLARCGACGAGLRGHRHSQMGRVYYSCPECGGVNRQVEQVDDRVTQWVVARLSRMDVSGLLFDDAVADRLARLEAQRDAVARNRADLGARQIRGEITVDALVMYDRDYVAELDRLDLAIAADRETIAAPVRDLAGLTGPDPETAFGDLPLGRRRAVVELLCTVTVRQAKGKAYSPDLVVIDPR